MGKELSIVMASSNSNYGGEVYREIETTPPSPEEKRVELSMFTLHEAFKNIDYEVIFVEWNRLEHRKPYKDYDFMKHPRVRVVEVPKEFSSNALGPDLQFHEMWAKNVGIRRASGDFILATNLDVLWLDTFTENLLEMWPMIAYRWTVNKPVLECGLDTGRIKEFCDNPSNRRNYDNNSNGDFTLLHRTGWYELQGYSIVLDAIAGCDMWHVKRAIEKYKRIFNLPFAIYHIEHPGRPLASGFGITNVSEDWGAPNEIFKETLSN
jgi:hypothetical protein